MFDEAKKARVKARDAKRYAENRDRVKAMVAKYRAENPDKVKACYTKYRAENRDKVNTASARWKAANPERAKATRAKWHTEDPERSKAAKAKDRAENPERERTRTRNRQARKRNAPGSHTETDIKQLFLLQKKKCAICRGKVSYGDKHVDHILPLIAGGSNDRSNLQITCQRCNLRKGKKDPIDFMRKTHGRLL